MTEAPSAHQRGLLDTSVFVAQETGRSHGPLPDEPAISVVTSPSSSRRHVARGGDQRLWTPGSRLRRSHWSYLSTRRMKTFS